MNPSNIAIHQSRHQDPLAKATNSLRPGDGSVSRISGEGAGLGGMNGCALTWVLATVASAGR